MKRLDDVLQGREGSYILPFLWLRGEGIPALRDEMEHIEACGIREVCLESRPHPDFCGPGWWRDVDFIMDYARERGMRVWVLDDDRFPTGHCNGAIRDAHPELARRFVAERHADVCGPVRQGALRVGGLLPGDGVLLKLIAVPKDDGRDLSIDARDAADLTGCYHPESGLAYITLPEGRFRVFAIYETQTGGSRADYMNLLDSRSVRVLLDSVYEPHYRRYARDFGHTFAGFFSDEPELGNLSGYDMESRLGTPDVCLPWSEPLAQRLHARWGEDWAKNLLALWYPAPGQAERRFEYMDEVSKLVYECFSAQVGAWCEQRGVEYIGHVIEDAGAHARLGCSVGHYFREQRGQHRAGVDVVHHQIVPGFTDRVHRWIEWETDGCFFHYGLAKLGASCAHIQPGKQGRALCEIFGNYGWAEGVALMRWLVNHMLARGINQFVPHAFSPAAFPDPECPPHFYARGHNPQFPFFAGLMRYAARACHLLSGGRPQLDAAVLYHAESEWSGEDCMPFHEMLRVLMERQLDADVVPTDALSEAQLENGRARIGLAEFGALVLPRCRRLPRAAAEFALRAATAGMAVYAADALPQCDEAGLPLPEGFERAVCALPPDEIAARIAEREGRAGSISRPEKGLRWLRYRHEDGLIHLFFNEETARTVETDVRLNAPGATLYDPWRNRAETWTLTDGRLPLRLLPGEALFVAEGAAEIEGVPLTPPMRGAQRLPLNVTWRVTPAPHGCDWDEARARILPAGAPLPNLNAPDEYAGLVGRFRYEAEFTLPVQEDARIRLVFPAISDAAQVYINEIDAGTVLGPAGGVEITGLMRPGRNCLRVEVYNTPFWNTPDRVSGYLCVPPTGVAEQPVLEICSYGFGSGRVEACE